MSIVVFQFKIRVLRAIEGVSTDLDSFIRFGPQLQVVIESAKILTQKWAIGPELRTRSLVADDILPLPQDK